MPTFNGEDAPQGIFLNMESHKLHKAFEASAVIEVGQPVKFAVDGTIVPLLAADAAYLNLGVSIHKVAIGEEATIAMRGYAVITTTSLGALNAGPVKFSGIHATTKRPQYVAAIDAATTQGQAIDRATAIGQDVEVVLV